MQTADSCFGLFEPHHGEDYSKVQILQHTIPYYNSVLVIICGKFQAGRAMESRFDPPAAD